MLHLEWAVVTQLDGEKTVAEIADILALSEEESQQIFSKLFEEGLLELVTISPDYLFISSEVLDEIEYELKVLLGPIASILFEDVLNELGKSRDKFDKMSLPILVDLLTTQISDPRKQEEFQKVSLNKIKPYIL
ncbi:MAG: hypothetical protein Kow0042_11160 [Calditrichia bacterium]